MNTKHDFPYVSSFKLGIQYYCYFKKDQLSNIKLVCDDLEFYKMFGLSDPNQD
jgi:hypothetical protein